MRLSRPKIKASAAKKTITGQSILSTFLFTAMGNMIAVMASTSPKLAMLDPTTFPMAMSGFPLRADFMLTISSGALVPKETTVNPTTIGSMFNLRAIPEAPFTNRSPPNISTASPKMSNK